MNFIRHREDDHYAQINLYEKVGFAFGVTFCKQILFES